MMCVALSFVYPIIKITEKALSVILLRGGLPDLAVKNGNSVLQWVLAKKQGF